MGTNSNDTWTPTAFSDYRSHFPATPELSQPSVDLTSSFSEAWEKLGGEVNPANLPGLYRELAGAEIVLIRGFLGNWMPGNLVPVRRALRRAGADAWIAANAAGATVQDNAARICAQIGRRGGDRPLWLFGHSKGGLEAMHCAQDAAVATRLAGVITAQTSRGASPVLDSVLNGAYAHSLATPKRRWAERVQRAGLHLIGAARGGRALTGEALRGAVAQTSDRAQQLQWPTLHAASWSIQPTAWLDSFHERLGEIAPGVAHDGQFYLEDLIWPQRPHVLLAKVDHAQPAMGGFGFDPARFWLAMMATALR
ncbi:MAG: hypothetical protein KC502_17055 [Myxococcales bacterium]|nr:hypothetical protein [Myxococcales bacterium]